MGSFEEAKGKVKQAAGDLTDNDALQEEGRAQASKGAEERKATEAKAEAKAHEAQAEGQEAKQKIAEETK